MKDFIENVVSVGTTYTSGSTVEGGISDAKFSPTQYLFSKLTGSEFEVAAE